MLRIDPIRFAGVANTVDGIDKIIGNETGPAHCVHIAAGSAMPDGSLAAIGTGELAKAQFARR